MSRRFGYALDARYLPLLLVFGFNRHRDEVLLTDDGELVATFGFVSLRTPLTNVTGAHITRGYRWWTAVGARGSMKDDGLTLGTNRVGGVCVHFGEKVPSRLRKSGHSALTVTVEDLEGLTTALGGDPSQPPAT
jgi:hypothetical protein